MSDVLSHDIAENQTEAPASEAGSIHDRDDPRAFFREMQPLGYRMPDSAKPILDTVLARLADRRAGTIDVLDIGCSYGINAALLKYDLSLGELYSHWSQSHLERASSQEILNLDRRFFAALRAKRDITVTGLDVAERAVRFGIDSGLLDDGFSANLEVEALPSAAKGNLAGIDLVMSTGCVGSITERTFNRLLPAITKEERPWIANFVPRTVPFDAIATALAESGYVTERLEETAFIQRRFRDPDERDAVMARLRDMGREILPQEEKGLVTAEFFLSRPKEEAEALALEQLFAR